MPSHPASLPRRAITLSHKRYDVERARVAESFRKSYHSTAALKLVPLPGGGAGAGDGEAGVDRLPLVYRREDEAAPAPAAPARELFPPATAGAGNHSLLKFYDLSSTLIRAVLAGLAAQVDTPFRVAPAEAAVIAAPLGRSILLLGRSGTGKTTVACFRLFAGWLAGWQVGEPRRTIFVTASGTLRREVERAFRRMRRAAVSGGRGRRAARCRAVALLL